MTVLQQLLTPYRAGCLDLPNRVVMAPLTRNRAGEGHCPTELVAEYYAQRASAGLIITEATHVRNDGFGYPNTPGLHTDAQEKAWRRVTDAVHARGGRIVVQLWHVGRISHPVMIGGTPIAPSAVRAAGELFTTEGMKEFVTPREIAREEIPELVQAFAGAAGRARAAGFDGVEIHGANGYLIDQFLRDGTNRRTDDYGGSAGNRARFLVEVVEAAAAAWEPGRIGVRLSPRNPFNDMQDTDPVATFTEAARRLDTIGLAYLHVMEPIDPGHPFGGEGERVTPHLRRVFQGPLMVNGGYGRDTGNAAIAHGEADLVAYGVPMLANPDLVERFAEGTQLNAPDPSTFYGGDARGYTDYPTRLHTACR